MQRYQTVLICGAALACSLVISLGVLWHGVQGVVEQVEAKTVVVELPPIVPINTIRDEVEMTYTKTITARVSRYSELDSCHYPTKDGGCLTASGEVATAGHSIACPYDIPLGTVVSIAGVSYTCDDRTARWVQDGFSLPTFDIFEGYGEQAHTDAINFGAQTLDVTISQ